MEKLRNPRPGAGKVLLVECLPSMHKFLGLAPPLHGVGKNVHAFNCSTWILDAGRSRVHGHPWLHGMFKTDLGYLRPFLCNRKEKKRGRKEMRRLRMRRKRKREEGKEKRKEGRQTDKSYQEAEPPECRPVRHRGCFSE